MVRSVRVGEDTGYGGVGVAIGEEIATDQVLQACGITPADLSQRCDALLNLGATALGLDAFGALAVGSWTLQCQQAGEAI